MSIEEIFDELKVSYISGGHHHSRPGWIQLQTCPFCSSDSYHLGINLAGRYGSCWKCGGHGLPSILEKLGVAREKAWNLFRGIELGSVVFHEKARTRLVEPAGRGPLLPAHRRYLESRGFDPDALAETWKLEGIGPCTNLAWRIYIPIIHRNARVSWTSRAIGKRVTQRYLSASAEEEAVNHKEIVYGLDYCSHSVVIVEGPTDTWNVGPGAGGLFGTAFSTAQVKKLIKIPMRFICFDSSDEAQKRAKELANLLAPFPGVTENIELDAEDPGSASPKEIRLLRKVARL